MGDEPRISEKWAFRRQENNFDDSSSDEPDSNSNPDPKLVPDSNQIDNETKTVTREQPVKTRKRRSKKDESKPEKAKQVRRRKPKAVCAEDPKKKEETVLETDDVGMFMKTLLDELTASRESLMDWMKTELYGSSDQNVVSRPPPKKRAVAAVAAQRSVKKRRTKKKGEEEEREIERQSKPDEVCQEMNKPNEKSSEIANNGGDQVQQLDYNTDPLNMFLKIVQNGQGGLGRNYFQQQEQGQVGIDAQTEKNATVTNQKSVVLAIKAPKLSQKQKMTREANTIKNRAPMVERTGSETQRDDNFAIPFAPQLSSSPSLQSFPVGSSLSSLFPPSSQGITSFPSDSNFQLRQPPVSQIPDLSEFQTGGQGSGNSLFHNNGYFSGFPAAFQPNLMASSYNFPAQVNPATFSQQRDNNSMFGGLRMAGGAIRYSGGRFPESEVGDGNNCLSDYRPSSGSLPQHPY